MSNALSGCRAMPYSGRKMFAILPFHHAFALTAGVFANVTAGGTICISGGLKHLEKDFKAFQPNYMVAVPLLAEGLHKKIWETARKENKNELLQHMLRMSNGLLKLGVDLRRKLFKQVLNAFGGQLEWMLVGGAPISEDCMRGLSSFGMDVLPGYGTTECSPAVSTSKLGAHRAYSAGQVMDCNEVKIDEHGEILVRGDNVFKSYYKDEQATAEAFTQDGWYKTGDLGKLDEDGYLYITGRVKNLIILSNGKNISPELLEQKLIEIAYVKEVLVFAEDDKIAAEVFLDEEMPEGAEKLEADIAQLNRQLPSYQRIAKTRVRDTEFPKTTTKKIKRN